MTESSDILTKIIQHKSRELAQRRQTTDIIELKARVAGGLPPRDFCGALAHRIQNQKPAVIAEIKKASPSKGVIRVEFDPAAIARSYSAAGAACLSILTDAHFFQGADEHLQQAREACELPVLRKDFIIDLYQVWESRAIGADCILLIVAALSDEQLLQLSDLAKELNMTVLVEVHDAAELERGLKLELPLLGINNRNLKSFDTALDTTLDLLSSVPDDRMVVTESGIHTTEDVALMRRNNVNGFLVGEACMKVADPGLKIRELFFGEFSVSAGAL